MRLDHTDLSDQRRERFDALRREHDDANEKGVSVGATRLEKRVRRLRREAYKQGLVVRVSRVRTSGSPGYGEYTIVTCDSVVGDGEGYTGTLAAVEAFVNDWDGEG